MNPPRSLQLLEAARQNPQAAVEIFDMRVMLGSGLLYVSTNPITGSAGGMLRSTAGTSPGRPPNPVVLAAARRAVRSQAVAAFNLDVAAPNERAPAAAAAAVPAPVTSPAAEAGAAGAAEGAVAEEELSNSLRATEDVADGSAAVADAAAASNITDRLGAGSRASHSRKGGVAPLSKSHWKEIVTVMGYPYTPIGYIESWFNPSFYALCRWGCVAFSVWGMGCI